MDFRTLTAAALALAALFVTPPLAISDSENSQAPDAPPGQVKPKPEQEETPPTEEEIPVTDEEATPPAEETPPAEQEPTVTEEEPAPEDAEAPTLPPAAPPALGEVVAVKAESGTIKVRLPGTSEGIPLDQASGIPTGSLINATDGKVRLKTATASGETQWAIFGGAKFRVDQRPAGEGLTFIKLAGPKPGACTATGSLASTSAKRRIRSLWGRGKGKFRTRGRHGAATVRGTKWLTRDRCDGTLVRVKHGSVWVKDFARGKRVLVKAGDQYLARARR